MVPALQEGGQGAGMDLIYVIHAMSVNAIIDVSLHGEFKTRSS